MISCNRQAQNMKTFTFLGRYSILDLFRIVSFSLKKRHKLQGESSMLKRISSEKLPQAVGSYSPATEVGNLIFTSGQLPINFKRRSGRKTFCKVAFINLIEARKIFDVFQINCSFYNVF